MLHVIFDLEEGTTVRVMEKSSRELCRYYQEKSTILDSMDDFTLNELNIKDDSANVARHVCAGV